MDNKLHRLKPYIYNLIVVLFPIIVSCAIFKGPPSTEESELSWEGKTPDQVLAHLQEDREKIADLTAAFSISVDPPPAGRPSHMQGVLFFARRPEGPYIRIKGLGIFGRILFDVVQKGDDIHIYVPSQQTLYRGRISREEETQNVWGNFSSEMFDDFSDTLVLKGTGLRFLGEMVILPLTDGEIRLDRKTGLVRQWDQQKRIIVYDHYKQQAQGLPPIPTHITIKAKADSQQVVCRLSQVSLNPLTTDVFDLSAYDPKIVRELDEMEAVSMP